MNPIQLPRIDADVKAFDRLISELCCKLSKEVCYAEHIVERLNRLLVEVNDLNNRGERLAESLHPIGERIDELIMNIEEDYTPDDLQGLLMDLSAASDQVYVNMTHKEAYLELEDNNGNAR